MGKVVLFFLLLYAILSHGADINECKTDIWFGNGVWNKKYGEDGAEGNKDELKRLVLQEIYHNNQKKNVSKPHLQTRLQLGPRSHD